MTGFKSMLKQAQPVQQAEPVAWMVKLGDVTCFQHHADSKHASVPLYTTPPAAERKPLTATTIGNMMPSTIPTEHDGALMEFARAIEAAHNIKEGT
jgi:hypothetical protein